METSDWRSHLNSLKASKLAHATKHAEEGEKRSSSQHKDGIARSMRKVDIHDKENTEWTKNYAKDCSLVDVEVGKEDSLLHDTTTSSFPDYSGIEESLKEGVTIEASGSISASASGYVDEISELDGIAEEAGLLNRVARTLAFGGGESIDIDNEIERNKYAPKTADGMQRVFLGDGIFCANYTNVLLPVPSLHEQHDKSQTRSSPPQSDVTPPRAPSSGLNERAHPRHLRVESSAPNFASSPSSSQRQAQGSKALTVQHITLPSDRDSGRLVISPTRSRNFSEFGQKLAACVHAEGSPASDSFSKRSEITADHTTTATIVPLDEWKEAFTESGKKYYYNRRTRISCWRLPANAVLVGQRVEEVATTPEEAVPVVTTVSSSTPARDCESVTTSVRASSAYSAASMLETPPGSCPQRRQRDAQRLIHNGDSGHGHIPSALTSTGADLFCMFCGQRDSTLSEPWLQHIYTCTHNKDRDNAHALQALLLAVTNDTVATEKESESKKSESQELSLMDSNDVQEKVTCTTCGRTFANSSKLAKHANACIEATIKRVPYDGSRKRIAGTPMELFSPSRPSTAIGTPNSRGAKSTTSPSTMTPSSSTGKHHQIRNNKDNGSPVLAQASVITAASSKSPDHIPMSSFENNTTQVCPNCDLSLQSKEHLLRHLRRCLLEIEKKSEINNADNGVYALQKSNTHHEVKEQLCPFCGKRNHDTNMLTRHLALCNKKRLAAHKPGSPRNN